MSNPPSEAHQSTDDEPPIWNDLFDVLADRQRRQLLVALLELLHDHHGELPDSWL